MKSIRELMLEAGFNSKREETAISLFKHLVKKCENIEIVVPESAERIKKIKNLDGNQLDLFTWPEDLVS